MKTVASSIRSILSLDGGYWAEKIKDKYGITCQSKEPGVPLDSNILRQVYFILNPVPVELIKDFKFTKLFFTYLGKNQKYSPNHGFFDPNDKSITLNTDIFYHPDIMDDFFDSKGYGISRPIQTFWHEFGHLVDDYLGDISLQPEWMKLSGWSKEPKPGLKRLFIKGKNGFPDVLGEMFYSPKAKFVRFYGKRNSYDDLADCFSTMLGGLRNKIPETKRKYLDNLLKKYYPSV
jgi:hypothetical protein